MCFWFDKIIYDITWNLINEIPPNPQKDGQVMYIGIILYTMSNSTIFLN